jgi:hypothetical protein
MSDSFIGRLNRRRSAALEGNNPIQNQPVKGGGAANKPALKEPELQGGHGKPAPKKAQGLSGAALRSAVTDIFAAGEKVGLPPELIAKYAGAMEGNVAALKDLAKQITLKSARLPENQRAIVNALPAQLIGALSGGFARLDSTSSGNTIRAVIEAISEILEAPRALDAVHARAMQNAVFAFAQVGPIDMGSEVKRAVRLVQGTGDGAVIEAASLALNRDCTTLLAAANDAQRLAIIRAAFDVAIGACKDRNTSPADLANQTNAAHDLKANPGQLELLAATADTARGLFASFEETRAGTQARLAEINPKNPAADRLSPEAQLLFYSEMARYPQTPAIKEIGEVLLNYLTHAANELPPPDVLSSTMDKLVELSGLPGITPKCISQLAQEHAAAIPAQNLPGSLAITARIVISLAEHGVQLNKPEQLATLANALIGRTEVYADQSRIDVLVDLIQGAAHHEGAMSQALLHGPRIAHSAHAIEKGGAHDLIIPKLSMDTTAIAEKGLDFAALASTYRLLLEDSLPRFVGIAVQRGVDPDTFLDKVSTLAKGARGNKDHLRSIRTLLVLADAANADVVALIDTINAAKMKGPSMMRTVNAVLAENNRTITDEQITRVIGQLQRGEDVVDEIEGRLYKTMVEQMGLNQLLADQNVNATSNGLKLIQDQLRDFFSQGLTNHAIDQVLFRNLFVAVLEDRFDGYRFTTPPAAAQLASLSPDAKRKWQEGQVMTHVRFDAHGQEEFDKRVGRASVLAKAMLENMEKAWGPLADLRAKHVDLVAQIHQVPKDDAADRRKLLVSEIGQIPAKIGALEWAKELADMSPATATPLHFAGLAEKIPSMMRMLGESGHDVLNELTWTVRIDDLSYSQVTTYDRVDLAAMYRSINIGTGCLRGWPNKTDMLAYFVDANKRMVLTKNQAGEERRAMVRIVERQDEGHVGEPMLLLERAYPDTATDEEKQRLIEHTLRRALEMGIPAAFATEYYWDAAKTKRAATYRLQDMNVVLEDLNRRYDTTWEKLDLQVLNRAGNMPSEYLDSAPTNVNMRGEIGARYYQGNVDQTFQNEFVILEPKKG